ncbi:hypothetical protein ERX27_10890 [Macrococcus brunensis]|uniref:Gram-positive cocci surface proteins LPxTG domain-containing protein n=1 Tax=Macrococcus brunensis TaxID=198483 RepID=A0A4R6BAK8_9STAP|nr:hypothetical protein [Macrococcus brunensis]TDL93338.1 hypothetical protein ERX27_10890 [Macrococcus brunensis]
MRKLFLTSTLVLTLTYAGTSDVDAAEPIGKNSADETIEIISAEMPDQPVTTETPKTEAPKTEAPSTESMTTELPSTEVPRTEIPVTEIPRTEAPTMQAPVTQVPITEAPSSESITTEQPPVHSYEPAPSVEQPELTPAQPAPSISQNQPATPPAVQEPVTPGVVESEAPQPATQPELDEQPSKPIKVGRFHPESSEKFYKSLDKQINDIVTKKLKLKEDKKKLHILPETGEEKSYLAVILLMLSGLSLLAFSRFKA